MEVPRTFLPLFLIIFLAFAVPLVLNRFRRLHLPIVVGEILAGVLIGRSGLGWVSSEDPVLLLLSEFGFVFLMFLSGMEIDFSNLGILGQQDQPDEKPTRTWNPVSIGAITFILT